MPAPEIPSSLDTQRRTQILTAALDVFLRYGFKKTSMSDVAGEAKLSRQGLYLHFPTKESLFEATIRHSLETSREEVAVLLEKKGPLDKRLLACFEITIGRYVGKVGAEAYDLTEAFTSLAGPVLEEGLAGLKEAVTAMIVAEAGGAKGRRVRVQECVDVLFWAAMGLKHKVGTREEFRKGMSVAIRVALAALA
ncbi:MAG TPA: TetR/AcrR family transcriptional regulator [Opitutaceae bacterium]